MKTGSLRRRASLAAIATLALALLVFDAALVAGLRATLESELRDRLASRAETVLRLWPSVDARQFALDGVDVEVTKGSDPPASTPTVPAATGLGAIGSTRTTAPIAGGQPDKFPVATGVAPTGAPTESGRGDASIVARPGLLVATVFPEGAVVTLSASTRGIDQTIGQLLLNEAIATILVIAGAGLLMALVTNRTLKPLGDVAAVADEIAAGEIGRRLRPTRTDTELGRMAAAFDRMVDALEASRSRALAAESVSRRFLADASHELRTPIAAVHATSETLLRQDRDEPDRADLELRLVRETARLGRLADDLLSLARLEGSTVREHLPVDLSRVCGDLAQQLQLRHPEVKLTNHCEIGLTVLGDREDLARAIGNLLDNAARATAGPGHIGIVGRRAQDSIAIIVTDDGPGVPRNERDRIFQPFVRLGAADGSGSGLGLAISRAIARDLGGDLTCDEAPTGASFTLRLPGNTHQPDGAAGLASGGPPPTLGSG
jgi:two-component system OmpR family sensor kinase